MHQLIQTGTIPLQLAEALMQQAVVGKVSHDCLVQSFFMLLHEKERDIIQQAFLGTDPFPTEDLIDSSSQSRKHQADNTELITKQFVCIMKLKEGMGTFWNDISAEEIKAVYSCCSPTFNNVANILYFEQFSPQDEKVSRWLMRYLKNQSRKILCCFMRFYTGCELVRPEKRIKVKMEIMSDLAMRPKSKTCFSVLTLPKNHQTYARFSENMDFYMNNPHAWDLSD